MSEENGVVICDGCGKHGADCEISEMHQDFCDWHCADLATARRMHAEHVAWKERMSGDAPITGTVSWLRPETEISLGEPPKEKKVDEITLANLPTLALESAKKRGFYSPRLMNDVFNHLSDEVEEARQAIGSLHDLPLELADIVLIVNSLAGYLEIDLEAAIKTKLEYNNRRTE